LQPFENLLLLQSEDEKIAKRKSVALADEEPAYRNIRTKRCVRCGVTDFNTTKKFVKVPDEKNRRDEWLRAASLENKYVPKIAYLCKDHFENVSNMTHSLSFPRLHNANYVWIS